MRTFLWLSLNCNNLTLQQALILEKHQKEELHTRLLETLFFYRLPIHPEKKKKKKKEKNISNLDTQAYKYKLNYNRATTVCLGIFYFITVTCKWFQFKCKQPD